MTTKHTFSIYSFPIKRKINKSTKNEIPKTHGNIDFLKLVIQCLVYVCSNSNNACHHCQRYHCWSNHFICLCGYSIHIPTGVSNNYVNIIHSVYPCMCVYIYIIFSVYTHTYIPINLKIKSWILSSTYYQTKQVVTT